MKHANKKYKDRLFHFLFGREEHKEWTLSLYNAVRGSGYTNINDIQFNTIENVLYLGMHNDISFLIMGELNLYEQQSSFNPNMPLRMLQYTAKVLEKYVKQNHLDKYGSHILELPVPKLVVFYNGAADKPDEMILSLRDSLPSDADPDIDVVHVLTHSGNTVGLSEESGKTGLFYLFMTQSTKRLMRCQRVS